ncbi:unnamed protein product [Heligmosomoides polygyrus]|uniref:Conserved domain protein n=1 Tax=Heligmosomoides polygyrus TaxID=6339 RepID=A0A183G761_HELPZ|nr:unnamed protein product [Heligmosomoides polygyrus]
MTGKDEGRVYRCRLAYGLIWTTLIAVILYLIFDGALMAGMRRLRCLCLGVTSVSVARADVHHAHAVVVTGNPQQVVYTTGATTTYPAATVYQPAMYQPAQPYAYQQPQYTQPPYPEGQPQYQPQPNVPPNPSTPDGPPDYKP